MGNVGQGALHAAIASLLSEFPANSPGVVIAQHIPETFSEHFAERLDSISALQVTQARHGDRILRGHAYVAPGNQHLMVARNGPHYICHLSDAQPVNRHRPSVDVLFRSVAKNAIEMAFATILTGMGQDGAKGLKELRESGAYTCAQDEATSVVWGMLGSAVKPDAAMQVLPLARIAGKLLSKISERCGA